MRLRPRITFKRLAGPLEEAGAGGEGEEEDPSGAVEEREGEEEGGEEREVRMRARARGPRSLPDKSKAGSQEPSPSSP